MNNNKISKKFGKFLLVPTAALLSVAPALSIVGCAPAPFVPEAPTYEIRHTGGFDLHGYEGFSNQDEHELQFFFNGEQVLNNAMTLSWRITSSDSDGISLNNGTIYWAELEQGEYNFTVEGLYIDPSTSEEFEVQKDFTLTIKPTTLVVKNNGESTIFGLEGTVGSAEPFSLCVDNDVPIPNDYRNSITWTIESDEQGLSEWLSINQATGRLSWANTCVVGTHTFNVKATWHLDSYEKDIVATLAEPINLEIVSDVFHDYNVLTVNDNEDGDVDGDEYVMNTTVKYADSIFAAPSTTYNPALNVLSLVASLASFPAVEQGNAQYGSDFLIKNFYTTLGFDNLSTNDTYRTGITDTNTIGLCCAHKHIDDQNEIIALTARSGNYKNEWAGNFYIGEGSAANHYFHEGFGNATIRAINFLSEYLINLNSQVSLSGKNVKIWLNGFSRGGAVANLLGGLLDMAIANNTKPITTWPDYVQLKKNNIFVYTGEAPAGANYNDKSFDPKDGNVFNNIFNQKNIDDLVTRVAPSTWDFTTFGKDKFVPVKYFKANNTDNSWSQTYPLFNNQLKLFKDSQGTEHHFSYTEAQDWHGYNAVGYDRDDYQKNLTPFITLGDLINFTIPPHISGRAQYVKEYQSGLCEILAEYFGSGDISWTTVISEFGTLFAKILAGKTTSQALTTLVYQLERVMPHHSPEFAISWAKAACPLYTHGGAQVELKNNLSYYFIFTERFNNLKVEDRTNSTTPINLKAGDTDNGVEVNNNDYAGLYYYTTGADEYAEVVFPYTNAREYKVTISANIWADNTGTAWFYKYDANTNKITQWRDKYTYTWDFSWFGGDDHDEAGKKEFTFTI